jgi:hypothetical protein
MTRAVAVNYIYEPMLNMARPTPVLDMTSTEPSMMLGVSMCHLCRPRTDQQHRLTQNVAARSSAASVVEKLNWVPNISALMHGKMFGECKI